MDPTNPPASTPAAAPEGVPAKFVRPDGSVDIAGLAKSYTELERSRSAPPAPPAAPVTPPPNPRARVAELQRRATEEITFGGRIADQTYADFESVGIDRETVDSVASARATQAKAVQDSIFNAAGGQENFTAMTAWARANDPAKAAALSNAMSSPDAGYREYAVKAVKAAYEAAHGTEGTLVTGTTPPSGGLGGAQPFQTLGEVTAAMKDKQYSENPAYREQVKSRLAASHRAGIDLGLRIMHNGNRIA